MKAKIKVLRREEAKKVLIDAGAHIDLVEKIDQTLSLWWKTGWMQEILLAQKMAGIKEVVEITLDAIKTEPEFPGDMPDELWDKMNGDRENCTKVMQNSVRLTKQGIIERLQAQLK